MILSIIDHLRLSYHPHDTYLTINPAGHWRSARVSATDPPVAVLPGLVIYRFAASLYYANSNLFQEEIRHIVTSDPPPAWLCLDAIEIGNVDFTGSEVLAGLIAEIQEHGVRLVFADLPEDVRTELSQDGVTRLVGDDAFFDSIQDVIDAYKQREVKPEIADVSKQS
jgi:MFS superfamily sulfate permease-like transporter